MKPEDAHAREQALDLNHHVIAVAPAGSGKTGLLVQRLLAALATVEAPEQVVAITFTNKAAAEIRERVSTLLRRAAGGDAARDAHDAASLARAQAVLAHDHELGWELAGNPDRLRASTIDGFNSRIATELPLLSGLGGHLTIADDRHGLHEQALLSLFDAALDGTAAEALRAAAASWLRSVDNRIDRLLPPLRHLLERRDHWANTVISRGWNDNAVLETLHLDHQRKFCEVLGAGTQTLVNIACEGAAFDAKLAWAIDLAGWPELGVDQADTYTRLAQLLVTKGGSLRKSGGINAKLGFPPDSPAKQLLQDFLTRHADDAALESVAAAVQTLPPARFPATLFELRDQLSLLLRHALAQLRVTMAARGETDYTEIALAAKQALRPDDGYGDALLASDTRIRHLLVDEMQDTSETQVELLEELTQAWTPGDGHSLFLVGDPQQSIYAFRNARVRLFMALWEHRKLGSLELRRAQLTVNFRSDPALITWFNDSFKHCFPVRNDPYTGEVAYTPAVAGRTAEETPADAVAHALGSADDEAQAVAERAAQLFEAGERSIAILARTRTHLPAVLAALRNRGVPYACQDIDALQALPVVRDLLACARALWHPEDSLHWAILLRAPWVGLAWADLVALSSGRRKQPWLQRLRTTPADVLSKEGRARIARLLTALDDMETDREYPPLAERVERLWLRLGGPACGDMNDLADARRTLQLLRKHASAGGFAELPAFERAVGELYASPAGGGVELMTIHKAKGLEFDHVLLIDCARKTRNEDKPLLHLVETPHGPLLVPKPPEQWPDADRAGPMALFDYAHHLHVATRHNESLRLLYVAATRARRSLHLYASLKRNKKSEFKPPAHSFAEALWAQHFAAAFERVEMPVAETPEREPQPPRAPRLPLDFSTPDNEALFAPRERRTLRPSEGALSALQIKHEDGGHAHGHEDNVYARLIGSLYHQAMQRIADRGISAWTDETDAHPAALAAGLRRLGMPEPQVGKGVARVLALVDRSLQSRHGRWLLAEKAWAAAEYALSGYMDGEWVAAAIDRCFEEADGTLWIVDYKTTAEAIMTDAVPAYVAECQRLYAPQLATYARLLKLERNFTGPVRTALYLAEPDSLVEATRMPPSAGSGM